MYCSTISYLIILSNAYTQYNIKINIYISCINISIISYGDSYIYYQGHYIKYVVGEYMYV